MSVTVVKRVEVGQVADVPLPYSAKKDTFAPVVAVIEFQKLDDQTAYNFQYVRLEGTNRVKGGGLGNLNKSREYWSLDAIAREPDVAAWLLPLIEANKVTAADVAP